MAEWKSSAGGSEQREPEPPGTGVFSLAPHRRLLPPAPPRIRCPAQGRMEGGSPTVDSTPPPPPSSPPGAASFPAAAAPSSAQLGSEV